MSAVSAAISLDENKKGRRRSPPDKKTHIVLADIRRFVTAPCPIHARFTIVHRDCQREAQELEQLLELGQLQGRVSVLQRRRRVARV